MISDGFYAPEYFKPRKLFDDAGFSVTVAAKFDLPVQPDRRQIATHPSVIPDVTFDKASMENYDALVFAGSLSTEAVSASAGVHPGHEGFHVIVVSADSLGATQLIAEGFLAFWSPR